MLYGNNSKMHRNEWNSKMHKQKPALSLGAAPLETPLWFLCSNSPLFDSWHDFPALYQSLCVQNIIQRCYLCSQGSAAVYPAVFPKRLQLCKAVSTLSSFGCSCQGEACIPVHLLKSKYRREQSWIAASRGIFHGAVFLGHCWFCLGRSDSY